MDKDFEKKYHLLEEDHWWFYSRRKIIIDLIKNLIKSNFFEKLPSNALILDIGCSGGNMIMELQKNSFENIFGIDISADAINECAKKNIANTSVMDAAKPDFKDSSFDIVMASDVLEHIENDAAALAEWLRILKPSGYLVIFVPAFMALWSGHDEINHHFRRYSKKEFLKKLGEAGFEIKRTGYWNFILFFPAALIRLASRMFKTKKTKNQLLQLKKPLNKFIKLILTAENKFLQFADFPFGVSIFAVCRKSDSQKK